MAQGTICVWTDECVNPCGVWQSDYWRTECGQVFQFLEGGPTSNEMKYCCYCGKGIKEMPSVTVQ